MKHPPITQGLEQATLTPSCAWEAFFERCWEYAAIARQRRKARQEAERENAEMQEAETEAQI
ncbi:hypothetical protein LBMAG21_09840 [Armatimonadota bacterium]|nr:hypothetical protein LBMAG21_09840 [Armatimonadota bacterium]